MRDIWPRTSVLNKGATTAHPLPGRSQQTNVQTIGSNPIPPDASDLSFEEPEQSIHQLS